MRKALFSTMTASAMVFTTTPASAATWIQDTVSGVFETGTDVNGVLGSPGTDLTGTPFSFSIFYRDIDIRPVPGYTRDYYVSALRSKGSIGDFQVPLSDLGGYWSTWEHAGVDWMASVNTPDGIASVGAYIAGFSDVWGPSVAYINYNGVNIGYTSDFNRIVTSLGTGAIPEPATWGMLLLGFGAIGAAMRHRRREKVSVAYA